MAFDPLSAGLGLVDTFVDKFVGDKDLHAKLKAAANSEEMQHEAALRLGQMEVNKAEAQSGSLFKGGWRPAAGWTCVTAMFYTYVLYPFMIFVATLVMEEPPKFPQLSILELMPILIGMLGLGSIRMGEKIKGVAAP